MNGGMLVVLTDINCLSGVLACLDDDKLTLKLCCQYWPSIINVLLNLTTIH